jgi:hypothetical protein
LDKEDDGSNTDEDSDQEHNKNMKRVCAFLLVRRLKRQKQQPKTRLQIDQPRRRRKAKMLLQEGINDGLFRTEYRMSHQSFKKLVELLRNDLQPKDTHQKKKREEYLDPETKVMMTLRWLAGGQYVDQCRRNGVSKAAVFSAFKQVIKAINSNPAIGVPKWPTTVEECNVVAHGWAKLSGPSESKSLFTTVIGIFDGILISTKSPTKCETNKPEDFRSGHKKNWFELSSSL